MSGGPSQLDTFDMKPEHANGGEFRAVATSVPGIRFSEHLPQLAQQAERLAIVRSLTTEEGDHARGTYLVRTGQRPGGPIRYPAIGATIGKALGAPHAPLPPYVSILPTLSLNPDAFSAGFLGPRFAPAVVRSIGAQASSPTVTASDTDATDGGPVAIPRTGT